MNNLLITFATLLAAGVVLVEQHVSLARMRARNEQLATQADVLRARMARLDERSARLQRQLSEEQEVLNAVRQQNPEVNPPSSPALVPPDPACHGGWPTTTPYFYLPKKDLACVGYRLLEGQRLTEVAATLFGMTPAERQAVDAAYADLYRKHRQLEIERMKPVEMPASRKELPQSSPWRYFSPYLWEKASGYIAYNIPSLESQAGVLSNEFASAIEQALGKVRAGYLLPAADTCIARRMDDTSRLNNLAWNARLVAFFQVPGPHGRTNLVYAVANEGVNGWTRTIQSPVNPDSQEAYYAQLFGVDLPTGSGPGTAASN